MHHPILHLFVWLQTAELRRDDRGQTAAEYLGILVLVAAIVVAVTKLKIDQTIATAISTQVKNITGGK